jgi:hypothetical protein
MFLDIIHRPFFYLKHSVSETGFCLRLQVKRIGWARSIELVPISGPHMKCNLILRNIITIEYIKPLPPGKEVPGTQ